MSPFSEKELKTGQPQLRSGAGPRAGTRPSTQVEIPWVSFLLCSLSKQPCPAFCSQRRVGKPARPSLKAQCALAAWQGKAAAWQGKAASAQVEGVRRGGKRGGARTKSAVLCPHFPKCGLWFPPATPRTSAGPSTPRPEVQVGPGSLVDQLRSIP